MSSTKAIQGFHHVALRASDFDRSVAFYQQMLGFTQKIAWGDAPKRAIMLDTGNGGIFEIFERPDEPVGETTPLFLHVCFRCNDVDGVIARVREAGYEVTIEPKDVAIPSTPSGPTPVRLAFFKGPDGEVIELFDSQAV